MKELLKRIWKKDEGFSLIELIIVIAILAIIAAIAVPNLIDNINNSRRTTDISNAKMIHDAVAQALAQDETLAVTFAGEVFQDAAAHTAPALDDALAILNGDAPAVTFKVPTNGATFTVTANNGAITVTATTSGTEIYPDSSGYN